MLNTQLSKNSHSLEVCECELVGSGLERAAPIFSTDMFHNDGTLMLSGIFTTVGIISLDSISPIGCVGMNCSGLCCVVVAESHSSWHSSSLMKWIFLRGVVCTSASSSCVTGYCFNGYCHVVDCICECICDFSSDWDLFSSSSEISDNSTGSSWSFSASAFSLISMACCRELGVRASGRKLLKDVGREEDGFDEEGIKEELEDTK